MSNQNVQTVNTNVNPGWQTVAGIGIQASPSGAVKAQTALKVISISPDKGNGMMLMEREGFNGTPTVLGMVRGPAKAFKFSLDVESTPESLDKLMCIGYGSPTTTAASSASVLPAVVSAATITIAQAGTAGSSSTSYVIYARSPQGDSPVSASSATATGSSALSTVNYNIISWTGVTGAMEYVVKNLTSNYTFITQNLSVNDTGPTGFTYSAPSPAVGNYQLYPHTAAFDYGTISIYEGNDSAGNALVQPYVGCVTDKLKLSFDKTASKPVSCNFDIAALWTGSLPSESQAGLNTMTQDLLDPWSGAFGVCMLGGAVASAQKYEVNLDGKLEENLKTVLNGWAGGVCFAKSIGVSGATATLYWDDDAMRRQFWASVSSKGIAYSMQNSVIYTTAEIFVYTPVNTATGIIYQLGVLATRAAIKADPTIKFDNKGYLTQEIEIVYIYDSVTGTDAQLYIVNSLANATIIAPGTLITGISGGGVNAYAN